MFGFSLIELLTVLAIVAIISVIGVGDFKQFSKKSSAEIRATELVNAIHLARSESLLRHERLVLCGSPDQINCSDNWQKGYIIRTMDQVIYHFDNLAQDGKLLWRSFPRDKPTLEFLPTGLPHSQNGTFRYCQTAQTKPAWAVVLNRAGRVRTVFPDKKGNIRDDKGVILGCV